MIAGIVPDFRQDFQSQRAFYLCNVQGYNLVSEITHSAGTSKLVRLKQGFDCGIEFFLAGLWGQLV